MKSALIMIEIWIKIIKQHLNRGAVLMHSSNITQRFTIKR